MTKPEIIYIKPDEVEEGWTGSIGIIGKNFDAQSFVFIGTDVWQEQLKTFFKTNTELEAVVEDDKAAKITGSPAMLKLKIHSGSGDLSNKVLFVVRPKVCHDWTAVHHWKLPDTADLLLNGTCDMPTAGYKVTLSRHYPQGFNPAIVLLDKVVTAPTDPQLQVPHPTPVSYHEVNFDPIEEIYILPDDISIPVTNVGQQLVWFDGQAVTADEYATMKLKPTNNWHGLWSEFTHPAMLDQWTRQTLDSLGSAADTAKVGIGSSPGRQWVHVFYKY